MTQGRNVALCGPLRAPANALIFGPESRAAPLLGEDQLARCGEPEAVGVAAVPNAQLAMAAQQGRAVGHQGNQDFGAEWDVLSATGKSTTGPCGLVWPEAGSAAFA